MRREALLPGLVAVLLAVQVLYLVYAVTKSDTEIFVQRGDGTISGLLAYNEYGSYNRGYRLPRLFRDYCKGCTVEVSGTEAFSVGQLAEVGRVHLRTADESRCPLRLSEAAVTPALRRFDLATDETPFAMLKEKDAPVWGRPVTVLLVPGVRVYRACRDEGRDVIAPVTGAAG